MKTIKEIAGELGVPKQRVYRFIKRECISEAHHEAGVMYYDDAAETFIKQAFSDVVSSGEAHHDAHHDAVSDAVTDAVTDAVIDLLRKELEIKNEQIRELNARLAESNAALVAAQQTAQAAQALHAGTIQKQLMEPEQPAGFFTRLFSSKR